MNVDWLKEYYLDNRIPLSKFNVIGIRDETDMSKDVINDRLGFFTDTELFLCPGTTDPSVYWTKGPERNKIGTFHLLEGFHEKIWSFGIHKGYEALVNDWKKCNPTKGWRDTNYNFTRDNKDIVVCDYFGVNFHRMDKVSIAKTIGKYSAGCQVVQSLKDFAYILQRAKESGQQTFSYMLFKNTEVCDG